MKNNEIMEEIKEVKAHQADMPCPKCGIGYMRPNGLVKVSIPPHFGHKCTNCDHEQYYGVRYPVTI